MDTQQITEALARMQQNLQGVESARQQVQQVANAYSSTRSQLENLATSIHQLSEDMSNVINSISENQTLMSAGYKGNFEEFGKRVNELKGATLSIQNQFSKECALTSSNLLSTTDATLAKLQKEFDDILKDFNKKASEEIGRISDEIDTFKTAASQMQDSFLQETTHVTERFKNELSECKEAHQSAEQTIVTDFRKSVDDCIKSFENIEKDFNQILNQHQKELDDFWTKMDGRFAPIAKSIEKLDEKVDLVLTQINNTNKRFLIAILASVLLSIALRFV